MPVAAGVVDAGAIAGAAEAGAGTLVVRFHQLSLKDAFETAKGGLQILVVADRPYGPNKSVKN